MPGLFDDLPNVGQAGAAPAQPTKNLFDDLPDAKPAEPPLVVGSLYDPNHPVLSDDPRYWPPQKPQGPGEERGMIVPLASKPGEKGAHLAVPEFLQSIYDAAARLVRNPPQRAEDLSNQNVGDLLTAGSAGISGTNLSGPTREMAQRAVAAERANPTVAPPNTGLPFGPSPPPPNGGLPAKWMDGRLEPTARQEVIEAGANQGVPVPRFVASDSKIVKGVAGGLSGTPVLGTPVANAGVQMAENLGKRVADIAGNATREPSVAGAEAKDALFTWTQKGFRKAMDDAYAPLDTLIKPETEVPLSKTALAAKKLTQADYESASDDGKRVIGHVSEALKRGKLTYAGLKELRTRIGERLNGDIAPEAGTSARALKMLYGALTEDLKFGVGQAGKGVKGSGIKKAQAEFDAANSKADELFELRRRITDVIGREGDNSAEGVFHRLTSMAGSTARADVAKLQEIKDAAGASWQKVVDTITARLGIDEKTGAFSPDRFLSDYNKRLSQSGKAVLYGKQQQADLDDIAKLAEAWSGAAKQGNSSGTGRSVAVTAAIAGAYANPLTLIADAATGTTLSYILSRPVGAKTVREFMRTYTDAATNPGKRAAYELAARRMATMITDVNDGKELPGPDTKPAPQQKSGDAGRFARPELKNALTGDAGGNGNALTATAAEGATATNPKTGERIQFRGGRWVPLQ